MVVINLDNDEKEYIGQSFRKLDFSEKEFSTLEFEDCGFYECNFNNTALRNCKFIDCHFDKCNLSNVKIPFCRFVNVEFEESKLIGVDWTSASWSSLALAAPFFFNHCILNDSSFFALKLPELVIKSCKAVDVDFREGDFSGGCFSGTDFSNSLFHNSNLTEADFTGATGYDIDIHYNVIKGAKFSPDEAIRLLNALDIELLY